MHACFCAYYAHVVHVSTSMKIVLLLTSDSDASSDGLLLSTLLDEVDDEM